MPVSTKTEIRQDRCGAVLYSVLPVMTESSRRATILLRWIMLSQSQPSTLPLRKAIIPIMQSGSILQHPEAETDMAGRCGAGAVSALIVSKFAREGLTPYEVEYRLKRGVKPIDDYNPEYKGKLGVGCVNALLALSDEPINFLPVITAQKPIEGVQIIPYGSTAQYVYTVSDTEDGTDLDYVLEDPSKSVTATKQDGTIMLTVNNRNCIAGDHIVKLTVTDRGGLSSTTELSIKLQPELLQEVELYPNPVVDILTIRASMTFSGEMRACLYDASGNLVLERKVTASLHKAGELDLSKVDGGSYTLKLYCNNKTITKNIIKL